MNESNQSQNGHEVLEKEGKRPKKQHGARLELNEQPNYVMAQKENQKTMEPTAGSGPERNDHEFGRDSPSSSRQGVFSSQIEPERRDEQPLSSNRGIQESLFSRLEVSTNDLLDEMIIQSFEPSGSHPTELLSGKTSSVSCLSRSVTLSISTSLSFSFLWEKPSALL